MHTGNNKCIIQQLGAKGNETEKPKSLQNLLTLIKSVTLVNIFSLVSLIFQQLTMRKSVCNGQNNRILDLVTKYVPSKLI